MRFAASRFVVALGILLLLGHTAQAAECTGTHYQCALVDVEHRNFQAAIQLLTAELQLHPPNLNALNLLGIAFTEAGQPQKAAATFQQVLIVDPHFYPARKNLAINEFDSKHFAEAEIQFNRVLKDAPADEISHLYLGEISFRRKDLAAAAKHYESGTQADQAQESLDLALRRMPSRAKRCFSATSVLKLLRRETARAASRQD